MSQLSRRAFVRTATATASGVAAFGILTRRGDAAEFEFKYANNNVAAHPMNVRLREAAETIRKESNGRLDLQLFPNSQLGGDSDVLSQLRTGAIQMFNLSGLILAIYVPAASINGVGFAFKDYDQVWTAMDGALGAYVRGVIGRAGLFALETMWDNGYRQVTSSTHPINTPDDLKGFKIRVPVSPMWTSHVQGARRLAGQHQHQRSLFGAADQNRRRPGEPALAHRPVQILRGAEIRLLHQPHVGRFLDARQRPRLGRPAEEPAGDSRAQRQCRRAQGARGYPPAKRFARRAR